MPSNVLKQLGITSAPFALATGARHLTAKKNVEKVPDLSEDDEVDDFTDDEFDWLNELFDEGFGDSIEFLPESEKKFLADEKKKK
jgi:hypothetical protein